MLKIVLRLPCVIFFPISFPAQQVLYFISNDSVLLNGGHLVLLLIFYLNGGWLRWWIPMKGLQERRMEDWVKALERFRQLQMVGHPVGVGDEEGSNEPWLQLPGWMSFHLDVSCAEHDMLTCRKGAKAVMFVSLKCVLTFCLLNSFLDLCMQLLACLCKGLHSWGVLWYL